MEPASGDEYDALIISVQKYGCFVELFEVFVEGLLPITAIEGSRRRPLRLPGTRPRLVAVSGGDSGRGRRSARRKSISTHLETRRSHPRPRRTHRTPSAAASNSP